MDSVFVVQFRCFNSRQEARLAPLTLLVGENSAGKTSFLALLRVLMDCLAPFYPVAFKEEPYDLGSFDDVAHYRGGKAGRAKEFRVGFSCSPKIEEALYPEEALHPTEVRFTFGKGNSVPVLTERRISRGQSWIKEFRAGPGENFEIQIGTSRGKWRIQDASSVRTGREDMPFSPFVLLYWLIRGFAERVNKDLQPIGTSLRFKQEDSVNIWALIDGIPLLGTRPFASAPVRSKPRRTYDPSRTEPDPEGVYIPMMLAGVYRQDKEAWQQLKSWLEKFGKDAGLFDEINIRQMGSADSDPFQVQIGWFEGSDEGPQRNIIDVGYGVSQSLPLIVELLRKHSSECGPRMFLLQQPEVHLHPRAQASLGSLFCEMASSGRQLIVETHSDHLMNRVRMDIRDGRYDLRPEDVSILYFERDALEVNIHSLEIDTEGNILNTPDGYRRFFMEETQRSLGL